MFNSIKTEFKPSLPLQQQLCCYIKQRIQPMHRTSWSRRTPSRPAPGTRPTRCPATSSRRTAARSSTPTGRNPGRSASTGGGGSLCPMGAWWLPTTEMQCGSGVGRPREWRGVGADHRPEVRAEGNATAVCSAQSSASGLRCGDSDVFSSQQSSYLNTFSSKSTEATLYFLPSSDKLCM